MGKLVYIYLRQFHSPDFVAAHSHPCWELVYYKCATGHSEYATSSRHLQKDIDIDFSDDIPSGCHLMTFSDNTFVIFPPNITHNEVTDSRADIICLGFEPEDDYEKAVEHLTFCANHDVDFSVFRYMQTLEQEFRAQRHGYREMLDCVTRELLLALARRTMEKESRTGLDYIVRYLDEYFMEDINIDGLVKMSGFSPSQFRLLFKQKMRVSPKQYILTKRLERIRDRLINSAIPLSEIAVECGFGDYYQFSAFFKRREGLSPKEFRKRFQVTEL